MPNLSVRKVLKEQKEEKPATLTQALEEFPELFAGVEAKPPSRLSVRTDHESYVLPYDPGEGSYASNMPADEKVGFVFPSPASKSPDAVAKRSATLVNKAASAVGRLFGIKLLNEGLRNVETALCCNTAFAVTEKVVIAGADILDRGCDRFILSFAIRPLWNDALDLSSCVAVTLIKRHEDIAFFGRNDKGKFSATIAPSAGISPGENADYEDMHIPGEVAVAPLYVATIGYQGPVNSIKLMREYLQLDPDRRRVTPPPKADDADRFVHDCRFLAPGKLRRMIRQDGLSWLTVSCAFHHGACGSPVIDLETGNFVAVACGGLPEIGENLALSVDDPKFAALLRDVLSGPHFTGSPSQK